MYLFGNFNQVAMSNTANYQIWTCQTVEVAAFFVHKLWTLFVFSFILVHECMHVHWHFHGVNFAVYCMPVHQSPALESPGDTEKCFAERARDGFCTCCSCGF